MLWVPAVEKYAESTAVKEYEKKETTNTDNKTVGPRVRVRVAMSSSSQRLPYLYAQRSTV